jgi:hypothetical protein
MYFYPTKNISTRQEGVLIKEVSKSNLGKWEREMPETQGSLLILIYLNYNFGFEFIKLTGKKPLKMRLKVN